MAQHPRRHPGPAAVAMVMLLAVFTMRPIVVAIIRER